MILSWVHRNSAFSPYLLQSTGSWQSCGPWLHQGTERAQTTNPPSWHQTKHGHLGLHRIQSHAWYWATCHTKTALYQPLKFFNAGPKFLNYLGHQRSHLRHYRECNKSYEIRTFPNFQTKFWAEKLLLFVWRTFFLNESVYLVWLGWSSFSPQQPSQCCAVPW